jgi:hypothetical protein
VHRMHDLVEPHLHHEALPEAPKEAYLLRRAERNARSLPARSIRGQFGSTRIGSFEFFMS